MTSMMYQSIIIRCDGTLLGVVGIPPSGGYVAWRYADNTEAYFESERKARKYVKGKD